MKKILIIFIFISSFAFANVIKVPLINNSYGIFSTFDREYKIYLPKNQLLKYFVSTSEVSLLKVKLLENIPAYNIKLLNEICDNSIQLSDLTTIEDFSLESKYITNILKVMSSQKENWYKEITDNAEFFLAISNENDLKAVLIYISEAFLSTKQYKQFIDFMNKTKPINTFKENNELIVYLGKAYFNLNEYDKVIDLLFDKYKSNSIKKKGYSLLKNAFYKLIIKKISEKKYDSAWKLLGKVFEISKENRFISLNEKVKKIKLLKTLTNKEKYEIFLESYQRIKNANIHKIMLLSFINAYSIKIIITLFLSLLYIYFPFGIISGIDIVKKNINKKISLPLEQEKIIHIKKLNSLPTSYLYYINPFSLFISITKISSSIIFLLENVFYNNELFDINDIFKFTSNDHFIVLDKHPKTHCPIIRYFIEKKEVEVKKLTPSKFEVFLLLLIRKKEGISFSEDGEKRNQKPYIKKLKRLKKYLDFEDKTEVIKRLNNKYKISIEFTKINFKIFNNPYLKGLIIDAGKEIPENYLELLKNKYS